MKNLQFQPEEFFCPILRQVMNNPTIAYDGYTYQKQAIQQWLQRSDQSPQTGQKLSNHTLIPNISILNMINQYKETHPNFYSQQQRLNIKKIVSQKRNQWDIINKNKNKYISVDQSFDYNSHNIEKIGLFKRLFGCCFSFINPLKGNNQMKFVQATYFDGVYYGEFKNGQRNGKGLMKYKDGSTYDGEWMNDKYHGKGMLNVKYGVTYKGQFINGQRQGYGKYITRNGLQTKEGLFFSGKQFGKHISCYQNGGKIQAQYKMGVLNGNHTYFTPFGDKIISKYENGVKDKFTIVQYANGDKYQGDYYQGKNGHGTLYYKNDDKIEGVFLYDKIHGAATFYRKDGYKYKGKYMYGQKNGFGIQYFTNGQIYEGLFQHSKRHGKGVLYSSNGQYQAFQFQKGVKKQQ